MRLWGNSIGLDPATTDGLVRYLFDHMPVGHFLRAVMEGHLKQAVMYADSNNRKHLHELAMFLFDHAPWDSWGNEKAYTHWISYEP